MQVIGMSRLTYDGHRSLGRREVAARYGLARLTPSVTGALARW